jgi:hypothetical protein
MVAYSRAYYRFGHEYYVMQSHTQLCTLISRVLLKMERTARTDPDQKMDALTHHYYSITTDSTKSCTYVRVV